VYADGVFELVWEVVPVGTGGYEDIVPSFEVERSVYYVVWISCLLGYWSDP